MADWTDYDEAFTLPDILPADSPWRVLYEKLLRRTQAELGLFSLVSPEILLVERYLTGYIMLRYRESLVIGNAEGFLTVDMAKVANQHWLGIAKEVTGLIDRARSRSDKDSVSKRAAVEAALGVLNKLPNDDTRRALVQELVATYDRMGV